MSTIGQLERATRDRVITLFRDEPRYRYLGDWPATATATSRPGRSPRT